MLQKLVFKTITLVFQDFFFIQKILFIGRSGHLRCYLCGFITFITIQPTYMLNRSSSQKEILHV